MDLDHKPMRKFSDEMIHSETCWNRFPCMASILRGTSEHRSEYVSLTSLYHTPVSVNMNDDAWYELYISSRKLTEDQTFCLTSSTEVTKKSIRDHLVRINFKKNYFLKSYGFLKRKSIFIQYQPIFSLLCEICILL